MASSKVQILGWKLIKPSNPTPQHFRHLKLSLFDQLAFPLYVHVNFYYMVNGDDNTSKNVERLEKSLSQILVKFYPLAGRFVKDDFLIDCNDQGVEFFEAQANGKLVDFLQQGLPIENSKEFLPWDVPPSVYSETSPLLAIQINAFDCGGIVLGMRISHIIADAFSLTAFINEWASTCRGVNGKVYCPSIDHKFSSLFPPRMFPEPNLLPLPKAGVKIVLENILFEGTTIATIKEKAAADCSLLNRHPSRFVVVLALIWKALMSVSLAKHSHRRDSIMGLTIDLRDKTALPMAEFGFGNFWLPVSVPFEGNAAKMELNDLMILLRNTIENARTRLATMSPDEIVSILLNNYGEMVGKFFHSDGVDFYFCSSWCRFPMYEADFGWGKPYWMGHATRKAAGICLMDSKNAGIEAWISLKEEDMVEFKRNLDILVSAH